MMDGEERLWKREVGGDDAHHVADVAAQKERDAGGRSGENGRTPRRNPRAPSRGALAVAAASAGGWCSRMLERASSPRDRRACRTLEDRTPRASRARGREPPPRAARREARSAEAPPRTLDRAHGARPAHRRGRRRAPSPRALGGARRRPSAAEASSSPLRSGRDACRVGSTPSLGAARRAARSAQRAAATRARTGVRAPSAVLARCARHQ